MSPFALKPAKKVEPVVFDWIFPRSWLLSIVHNWITEFNFPWPVEKCSNESAMTQTTSARRNGRGGRYLDHQTAQLGLMPYNHHQLRRVQVDLS